MTAAILLKNQGKLLPPWATTTVLLSVSKTTPVFLNANTLLHPINKKNKIKNHNDANLGFYANDKIFALVLPNSSSSSAKKKHACDIKYRLKQKENFFDALSFFYKNENAKEMLNPIKRVTLPKKSIRPVLSFLQCSDGNGNSSYSDNDSDSDSDSDKYKVQDHEIEMVDGVKKTSAWLTISSYYCNIRT